MAIALVCCLKFGISFVVVKIGKVHERTMNASAEQLEAIVADMDGVWPTQISPAPYPDGELLQAGTMRWQEFDRPGALRAFRVVSPPQLRADHWFEVEPVEDGTVLRHTIDGEAFGEYEAIWRDRIAPLHDMVLEALLDNVQQIVERARRAGEGPGRPPSDSGRTRLFA
jgi:hypothetical protein